MGVYRRDYLMIGAKIDPEKFDWDKYEAEVNGADGRRFDMVYDSMSGEYLVAGQIISSTDQFDDENDFIEITDDMLPDGPNDLLATIRLEFPEVKKLSLLMFKHYY